MFLALSVYLALESSMKKNSPQAEKKKPGLGQVLLSTLAAAFGVQSNKNRERDFSQGNLAIYIAAGALVTVCFVLVVLAVVKLVLD